MTKRPGQIRLFVWGGGFVCLGMGVVCLLGGGLFVCLGGLLLFDLFVRAFARSFVVCLLLSFFSLFVR